MIDPPRLSSFGGDASDLLHSARSDGPSADARLRTAAALGVGLATTSAGILAVTALSKTALTTTAAASVGSKTGAIGGTALVLKVLGATLVGSVLAAGTVAIVKPAAFFPRTSETVPTDTASNASKSANAANAKGARRPGAPVPIEAPVAAPPASASAVAVAVPAPAPPNDFELGANPVAAPRPAQNPSNGQMSQTAPSSTSLEDEVSALDDARTKLASGDGPGAMTALDAYKHTFPKGTLAPESTVLRIEAYRKMGDDFKARSLGESFLEAHPNSPQARRVRSILERIPATPQN